MVQGTRGQDLQDAEKLRLVHHDWEITNFNVLPDLRTISADRR